jgi:hypothetical protein
LGGEILADALQLEVAMARNHSFFIVILLLALATPTLAPGQGESADERARKTEAQMTDDERFGLI